MFEITRTRESKGKIAVEIVYGITSLTSNMAGAEKLLQLTRKHWEIENMLHYVRDVTFNEDRCRVRNRNKAHILAAIRNTAITILRRAGFSNMVEGREFYSDNKIALFNVLFKRTE